MMPAIDAETGPELSDEVAIVRNRKKSFLKRLPRISPAARWCRCSKAPISVPEMPRSRASSYRRRVAMPEPAAA